MSTYIVDDDPLRIVCLLCGMVSYHPEDVRHHYCSSCKRFHDDWGDSVPYESFIRLLACVQVVCKKRLTGDPQMPWSTLDLLCERTLEAVMGTSGYQRWRRAMTQWGMRTDPPEDQE